MGLIQKLESHLKSNLYLIDHIEIKYILLIKIDQDLLEEIEVVLNNHFQLRYNLYKNMINQSSMKMYIKHQIKNDLICKVYNKKTFLEQLNIIEKSYRLMKKRRKRMIDIETLKI